MAKDFAKQFYGSKRWRHCADAYLVSVGHLCERCLKAGRYEPAEIVHHKIHITPGNIDDPDVTLNFGNLEALCRSCHALEHSDGRRKDYSVGADGRVTLHGDTPMVEFSDNSLPQP